MILSHQHRFIFIKTQKSAGTSVEVALSGLCGADDILTPIGPKLPESRPRDAQNYLRGEADRVLRADGLRQPLINKDFFNHMRLAKVASYVGDETVGRYFKFGFVRNPWDRQVSLYHFRKFIGVIQDISFLEWMKLAQPLGTLDLFKLRGEIAMDFIGRYENLDEDFAKACRSFGVSQVPPLPHAKAGIRPPDNYRDYYDGWARKRVAEMCADEIALFGYEF